LLVLFIGDDWAEDHHDIELVDEAGRRLACARLPEGVAGVAQLHALIAEHGPDAWAELEPAEAAARVVVGIETGRGPWVQAPPRSDSSATGSSASSTAASRPTPNTTKPPPGHHRNRTINTLRLDTPKPWDV
jgi:hypothetical protein